jgi:hypothetical protein
MPRARRPQAHCDACAWGEDEIYGRFAYILLTERRADGAWQRRCDGLDLMFPR